MKKEEVSSWLRLIGNSFLEGSGSTMDLFGIAIYNNPENYFIKNDVSALYNDFMTVGKDFQVIVNSAPDSLNLPKPSEIIIGVDIPRVILPRKSFAAPRQRNLRIVRNGKK